MEKYILIRHRYPPQATRDIFTREVIAALQVSLSLCGEVCPHMTQIPAYLNTATTQTPHPTVTASVDGPVGYASLELAVLACPRSTRCLYVIKTLDVWKRIETVRS